MHLFIALLILFLQASALAAESQTLAALPTGEETSKILSPLVEGVSGGLVVGFTNGQQHRVYGFGKLSNAKNSTPDEKTIFEIGSITKVFTSLLLADMYRQRKLSFDDPVRKFMPPDLIVPELNGRQINLFQLATHSSGMPRDPDNLQKYAKYGKDEFHEFLRSCKLKSAPGTQYLYSNAGYRLLGEALENAANMPYEDLLRERVLSPLNLKDTKIILDDDSINRFAQGYGKDAKPIPNAPITGGPAGGLKSTANDLLLLLDAAMMQKKNPLESDFAQMCKRRFNCEPGESACLGWFRHNKSDSYGKLGQIHGFSSCVEFSPSKGVGIVVLSSTLQLEAARVLQKCNSIFGKCWGQSEWN